MSKIICDICGTTYQESSECCPICGCSQVAAAEFLGADFKTEETLESSRSASSGFASNNRRKEIFDYDEVNSSDLDDDEEEDDGYDEEEEEEDAPRSNTFVVILLTLLIIGLLVAAGFIFFRFFLPNMKDEETVPVSTQQQLEDTVAATEATIPCENMLMTNASVAELNSEGQQFLLHIKTIPEDTTDVVIYTSADESIATVTEDGKITAIAEGETIVYISCGKHRIECPVIVAYVEETVPPTTEAPVQETEAPETTAPVEVSNVTLKLKKTDVQLGVYYEFQLELDCELKPEDVTWTSEHPHIAKVDEQGNVTALKEGTTSITAKYGTQEAQCIVRCGWY